MTAPRKITLLLAVVALAAASCSGASTPQGAPAAAQADTGSATAAADADQTNEPPASQASDVGPHCIDGVCPTFDGQEISSLHERPVWSLTLLRDGTIASGDDLTVRLWRLDDSGPQLNQSVVVENPSFGRKVVDIGNGRVAVTGDAVVVAELATQEILATLQGSDQVVLVGADKLATASLQSGLFLWDLTDLSAPIAQLDGSVDDLTSTDGMIYFTRHNTLLEWNGIAEPTEVAEVEGLWNVLATSELLYLGDDEGVITVINRTSREVVAELEGLSEFGVSAIVQLPNGHIAAGGATGDIAVWNLANPTEPEHLGAYSEHVNALLAMPDGTLIASIDGDGSVPGVVALFRT